VTGGLILGACPLHTCARATTGNRLVHIRRSS
jgi:hypothetical protein